MVSALITALTTEVATTFTAIAPLAATLISGYIGYKLVRRFIA